MDTEKSQLIEKLNNSKLEIASRAANVLIDEYKKAQSPKYLEGTFRSQIKYKLSTGEIFILEKRKYSFENKSENKESNLLKIDNLK